MDQLEKNKLISEKGKQTRVKRKTQVCKTFTFKVNKSSLTAEQKEWLTMIFVEAKWIYNYLVGLDDGSNICDARRYKELYHITHLDKDRNVIQCDITHLGSSMMQGVIDKIRYAISGLSKLKENGKQVGHLKFKTEFNTLFLKQYGITHKIVGPNKIKIQGCELAPP